MERTTNAEVHASGRDYTDEEIRSFVRDLESLRGGDLTVALLVGCGERAVAPLREYLLNGTPRSIFQPRQRAVEALAELGAKDVLMEYLSQHREISDAVARFGEEAVQNSAARELTRWLTEEVFDFLMSLAQRKILPGVIEALAKFQRPEAVIVFLEVLADDVSRPAAEEALRGIAEKVKPTLLQASKPASTPESQTPQERRRRRSVVRILADMVLSADDWWELKTLLEDEDTEIRIMANEIAVDCSPTQEQQQAARYLIGALESAHWYMQIRIQDCLLRNYTAVRDLIARIVETRRRVVKGEPLADPVLRILEKLQSTAEQSEAKEKRPYGN